MSHNPLLVVLGSGPGIGVATASLFASKNFNVALLSRNAERLKQDVAAVHAASSNKQKVQDYPVDIGDHVALKKTLEKVTHEMGMPEVVFFNAARVAPSTIGEYTEEDILEEFKVTNLGLYTTATYYTPHLTSLASSNDPLTNDQAHPCIFLSGGGQYEHPLPFVFSLGMVKAAQVNLMGSLAQTLGPQGVHVAVVNIGGAVSDDDPVLNKTAVAKEFWTLYGQSGGSSGEGWEERRDVGDIREFARKMGVPRYSK